jgi:transcriptional regulator with XRE-family HTH domain
MLRIKVLRLSRGMSQWALSQAAGVSQGRYSYLERGLVEATSEERERLAQILGGSASTLFRPAFRDRKPKREMVVGVAAN